MEVPRPEVVAELQSAAQGKDGHNQLEELLEIGVLLEGKKVGETHANIYVVVLSCICILLVGTPHRDDCSRQGRGVAGEPRDQFYMLADRGALPYFDHP